MNILKKMATQESFDTAETKTKIITLFKNAKKYVWMSSALNSDFYNDPDVATPIKEALEKVSEFRILIDGKAKESIEQIEWFADIVDNEKVKIRELKGVPHWIIVDGRDFRLEKQHELGVMGTNNVFVRDMEFSLSEVIQFTFEEWWDSGDSID